MLLPWRHNLRGSDSPMQSHWAITLELWVLMMRSSRSVTMPPVWVVCQRWSTLLFNNTENTLKTHWGNTKHYSPSGLGLWFYSLTLFDVIGKKRKKTITGLIIIYYQIYVAYCIQPLMKDMQMKHLKTTVMLFFLPPTGWDRKLILFCEWGKWAGFLSGWH